MKAIFITLCGCSQMLDISEKDLSFTQHYRVPIRSPHSVQNELGTAVGGLQYKYREFSFESIEIINGQKIAMYVERWDA
jgi:hypothetical protein